MAINILPPAPALGQPGTAPLGDKSINILFWTVAGAVALIGLGSFALSFQALHALALGNGQPGSLAWIWPVIVDLSMVIYTAAILVFQLLRTRAQFPIALTLFYGGVTITGNLLHAPPTWVGWFVAALPPLSLLLATELLRELAKHRIERRAAVADLQTLAAHRADLQAEADALATHRADLQTEADALAGTVDRLKAQIADLKKQRKEAKAAPRAEVGQATKDAARLILLDDPAISGSELGRQLGKSPSLGRSLKRELTPAVNGNGQNGKVTQ